MMQFRDRAEAGQQLAVRLHAYANRPDVLVLGLPRGGVPVAFEVARAIRAPLDVMVVRKLGVPGQEELAMGARWEPSPAAARGYSTGLLWTFCASATMR